MYRQTSKKKSILSDIVKEYCSPPHKPHQNIFFLQNCIISVKFWLLCNEVDVFRQAVEYDQGSFLLITQKNDPLCGLEKRITCSPPLSLPPSFLSSRHYFALIHTFERYGRQCFRCVGVVGSCRKANGMRQLNSMGILLLLF